jgi:cholesterol oxidase
VRTNAESLIGVHVPHSKDDLSKGIAIGSGFYIDTDTHIEATRYPAGSDAMGRSPRPWRMDARVGIASRHGLGVLLRSVLRHPWHTIRCLHPFGFARETLILLYLQSTEGHIAMRHGRPWIGPWPFRKSLYSRGKGVPTFISQANDFASKTAALIGGTPVSMLRSCSIFRAPPTSWEAARLVRRATAAWWTHRIAHMVTQICTSATVR